MASNLPMDVICTEILARLPGQSLLRFKCVCKSWNTLISTQEFISLHIRHSDRFLIFKDGCNSLYSCNLQSPNAHATKLLSLNTYNRRSYSVVGCCNGLLCIAAKATNTLILMNPSLGIYKITNFKGRFMLEWDYYGVDCCGFGFDSDTGKYKLVWVVDYVHDAYGVTRREVRIYSFKTGCWRTVEFTPYPEDSIWYHQDGVLIDNHLLHWKLWRRTTKGLRYRVGVFNLRTEKWSDDVLLPVKYSTENKVGPGQESEDSELDYDWARDHLGVYNGCLCLVNIDHNDDSPSKVDVWVMKEYGVRTSWVKLSLFWGVGYQPFPPLENVRIPVDAVYNNGRNTDLLLYDECLVCVGSLVTIPGGHRI